MLQYNNAFLGGNPQILFLFLLNELCLNSLTFHNIQNSTHKNLVLEPPKHGGIRPFKHIPIVKKIRKQY